MRTAFPCLAALAAVFVLAGCPGAKIPGKGGGGVDPNACGDYATVSDAGRKLNAFLDATATLQKAVKEVSVEVRTGCDAMAKELGQSAKGSNKEVCDRVLAAVKEDLKAGIKAEASLTIDYKPAVCTINIDAGASFAAKCEAKAEGDMSVRCDGTCTGTCSGACDGTCEGDNSGGECNGTCDGSCGGSCSGGCQGSADVEASAECEAQGEIHASADMQVDASVVVDAPRADRAIAALKAGLPAILTVKEKITPIAAAAETWVKTSKDAIAAGKELAGSLKDQALCLTAQLNAAASAAASVKAEVSFSVEVSAEASATAGTN
jgi:hypothetical protein